MLEITFGSAAFICFSALIWTARGLAYFLSALALHELGHLVVLAVCRAPVRGVRLGFGDIEIRTDGLPCGTELLCAWAGPAMNLLLWLLHQDVCAPFAAVNLLLGAYNLLPVLPLDGGRMWLAALRLLLEERTAARISTLSGMAFAAAMLILAISVRQELGWTPALFAAGLGLRLAAAKNSNCFCGRGTVQ